MSLVIHGVFDFLTLLLLCLIIGTRLLNVSESLSKKQTVSSLRIGL